MFIVMICDIYIVLSLFVPYAIIGDIFDKKDYVIGLPSSCPLVVIILCAPFWPLILLGHTLKNFVVKTPKVLRALATPAKNLL